MAKFWSHRLTVNKALIGILILSTPLIALLLILLGNPYVNFSIIFSIILFLFILFCMKKMNNLQKYKGIMTPTNLFSIVYILLYFVMTYDLLFLRGYEFNDDLLKGLIKALLIAFLGYLFFFLGFTNSIGKKISFIFPSINFKWSDTYVVIVSFFLLSISTISSILILSESGGIISHLSKLASRRLLYENRGYLLILDNLSFLNLYMVFLYWIDTKKGKWLLTISVISAIYINLIHGSRISFLVILLALLIIYAYKGFKVSWKFLIITLAFISVWAVIYGILTREILPYGDLVFGRLSDIQTENSSAIGDYLLLFWNRLAPLNFDSLNKLIFTLERVPKKYDFLYGESFLGILSYFIPRALFPDKPYPVGMLFTQVFFPSIYYSGSGTTPSLLVDFYWNFGIFGIIFGMFGFGTFYKILSSYAERTNYHSGALMYLAVVVSNTFRWLKAGSDTPTQVVLNLLIPWLFISFIFLLIKRKNDK